MHRKANADDLYSPLFLLALDRKANADDFPDMEGSPSDLSAPRATADLLDAFPERPSGFLQEVQRGMDGQGQPRSTGFTPRGGSTVPQGVGPMINALGGLVSAPPLPPIPASGDKQRSPSLPPCFFMLPSL